MTRAESRINSLVLSRRSGPVEESKSLLGPAELRDTPDIDAEGPHNPLRIPTPDVSERLKAALNVVEAEEQALDDPEDLTSGTDAHKMADDGRRPGVP